MGPSPDERKSARLGRRCEGDPASPQLMWEGYVTPLHRAVLRIKQGHTLKREGQ